MTSPTTVFEGVRVLDLTRLTAGSLTSMVLADFGASVLKAGPAGDHPAAVMWERGQGRVELDLDTPEGQAEARRLAAGADVVLASYRPGEAEERGLDEAALRAGHEGLVYCSITAFDEKGPYAHYPQHEQLVHAKAGRMMDFSGQVDRDGPVYSAVNIASYAAAGAAVQGIAAALRIRERHGVGQRVSTSLQHGLTPYDIIGSHIYQTAYKQGGEKAARESSSWRRGWPIPYLAAQTKDGIWLQFSNNMPRLYAAFISAIGLDEIWSDPRFAGAPGNLAGDAAEELTLLTLDRIRSKTWAEWQSVFDNEANVSVEPYVSAEEGLDHPQMLYNGSVLEIVDEKVGPTRQLGPLAWLTGTPARIPNPEPPTEKDFAEPAPAASGAGGAVPAHALDGLTVLEFAGWYAAPFATTLIADLGARVIKVEPPGGDPFRAMGGVRTTAGKESIVIDLQTPRGQEIARRLAERADAVLHNFRPGVPERIGIDYATLSAVNSRLVYIYAGLYGDSGPSSHKPGFHPTAGAAAGGALYQAGVESSTSFAPAETLEELRKGSLMLQQANEGNPDPNGAVGAATALMLGLLAQQRTGAGQYLTTNMVNSSAYSNADDFFSYAAKPPRRLPDREGYGLGPLYRLYRAADGWVFLAAPSQEEWESLVGALGTAELGDHPGFRTADLREQNADELAEALERIFLQRGAHEWEQLLTAADVGCVRADEADGLGAFLSTDPGLVTSGFMIEVVHPEFGAHLRAAPVVDLSLTPGVTRPGNSLGQDTDAILAELGYSEDEVRDLRAEGIVA